MKTVRRSDGQTVSAVILTVVLLHACAPARLSAQESSVTIYQGGSAFVRRSFPVAVARGTGTAAVTLGPTNLDPSALVSLDDDVQLRAWRLMPATGRTASLRRAIGRDLDFITMSGDTMRTRRATLLSLDPPAVRIGGRVMYQLPGEPVFPDSLVELSARLEVTTEAARATNTLRLGYFAQGLQWRASYTVLVPRVGGGPAALSGTATIDNSGLSVRGAEVQLSSGTIRRVSAPNRGFAEAAVNPRALRVEAIMVSAPEGVGETRVYSLPGRVDFEPGVVTSTALFLPTTCEVERRFVLNGSGDAISQWTERADSGLHPAVVYHLRRLDTAPCGATAIPAGLARVFAPDSAGRLQLLGEVSINNTPAGRDLDLETGTAFDVVADRVQTAFERRGERDVTVTYRIRVQNAKDEPVIVVASDEFPGRWEVLNSTVPAERASSQLAVFRFNVAPRSAAVLEYRVRVRW